MLIEFDPDHRAKGAESLQVEMVRDEDGTVIYVPSWVETKTEGEMANLRVSIRAKKAQFTCFCCGYPVLLRKSKLGGHHFAHMEKDASEKANCLYQQNSVASEDMRNRMRYQGKREGERHRNAKSLIARVIGADPNFSDIKVEKVWKTFEDGWRKPDVSAVYKGIKVVFEAQVSNTYPRIVAERTEFYRKQGCVLIWVYDFLDESGWRTLHSDNFCTNGQQLFFVDDGCASFSESEKEAHFKIYSQKPDLIPYQRDDRKWILRLNSVKELDLIGFSRITLDAENQTATYFDISIEKWRAEHKILCATVQAAEILEQGCFERLEASIRFVAGDKQKITEATVKKWPALICALESARLGQPIGTKLANVYCMFNFLYDHRPEFLLDFVAKIEEFGHSAETASGAWKSRLTLLKKGKYKKNDGSIVDIPQPHPLVARLLGVLF